MKSRNLWKARIAALFLLNFGGFQLVLNSKQAKSTEESDPAGQSAFAIAETLEALISVSRDQYARDLVVKLEKEGAGASVDFKSHPGHIPVPDQMIEAVAEKTASFQTERAEELFTFVQRSRWYLNPANNLKESFDKEAWDFLMNQQEEQQKSGKSLKSLKWKPFIRVVSDENGKTLRYFSPVTASDASCVHCHNKWEQLDEIKTIRELRGVAPGKIFKNDELLGAVSITVAMDKLIPAGEAEVESKETDPASDAPAISI